MSGQQQKFPTRNYCCEIRRFGTKVNETGIDFAKNLKH